MDQSDSYSLFISLYAPCRELRDESIAVYIHHFIQANEINIYPIVQLIEVVTGVVCSLMLSRQLQFEVIYFFNFITSSSYM